MGRSKHSGDKSVHVETARGMRFVTTEGMGTRVQMVQEEKGKKKSSGESSKTETSSGGKAKKSTQKHSITAPKKLKKKTKHYGKAFDEPIVNKKKDKK